MKAKRLAFLTAVIVALLLVFLDLRITSHPKPALASGDITIDATIGGAATGLMDDHYLPRIAIIRILGQRSIVDPSLGF